MSYIAFNDGAARTLRGAGGLGPAGTDRFAFWKSTPKVIGARHHTLEAGVPYVVEYRTDWLVTIGIANLRSADQIVTQRLSWHLQRGKTVDIYTEDLAARTYLACYLAEGAEPEISDPNEEGLFMIIATLRVPLVGADPDGPLCVYSTGF